MTGKMARRVGMMGAALALIWAGTAQASPRTTAQTMLDRLQIEDLVIDYYAQLGGEKTAAFGEEYVDDAELVLGERVIKGKAAIKALYAGLRTSGEAPRRMNVLVSNPRISVTGDTAHGEFVYTGIVIEAPNKAPLLHEQGREVDEFVKIDGEWKIKRRQIISDANEGFAPTPRPEAAS